MRVDLAGRGYEVRIGQGLLERAGQALADALGERRLVVVSDAALRGTSHVARLARGLAGADADWIDVPSGEASKSFAGYGELLDEMLALRPDRSTVVVAFGGGVVGDLAGFAAASLLRGVPLVQLPTTLLAQVDSAVGGKTGINSQHGKNLVGAFHQPSLVLADLDCLSSLPDRELRAGYAEVVKYGLLGDSAFFGWLEVHGLALLAGDVEARRHAVTVAVRAKARIVEADEHERADRRALLNLGHTFAHAYETLTGYGDRLLHGEAVALGLVQAFGLSSRLGFCPEDDVRRVVTHLRVMGLPTDPREVGHFAADDVIQAMQGDKKVEGGRPAFVLVHAIGRAFVSRDVPPEILRDHLRHAA
ncbi:MAG: 3-dehydroquinate synthase [Pseudomonadota bacterium]